MKIPATLKFEGLEDREIFHRDAKEYKSLQKMREDGTFRDYQAGMIALGVSIRYDQASDVYAVQRVDNVPSKLDESELYSLIHGEEEDGEDTEDNIDTESSAEDIAGAVEVPLDNPPVLQPEELEIENKDAMQVITLDDALEIIRQMFPDNGRSNGPSLSTGVEPGMEITDVDGPLTGGQDALKQAYFQGDGNETLDSEFAPLDTNIQNMESKIGTSYIEVIGGAPSSAGTIEQPGAAMLKSDDDIMNPNYSGQATKAAEPIDVETDLNGEEVPMGASRLVADLPTSSDWEDEDDEEFLLDSEEEPDQRDDLAEDDELFDPTEGHPDIARISGDRDFSPEEEEDIIEFGMPDVIDQTPVESVPAVNMNKQVNLGGQLVQIVLTGVMITMPELTYIGESVARAGAVLKKVTGNGNELNIMIESEGKPCVVKYVDLPSKTPFTVNRQGFSTLQEALDKMNYNALLREAEIFGNMMDKNTSSRALNPIEEADITKVFEGKAQLNRTWSVMPVGMINLKNGLNETYSNVVGSGVAHNTLLKLEDGKYMLMRGELREQSKVGTRRDIIDPKNDRSYGFGEVIGIYENTQNGLGQIMYDIKKTSIPLMAWR